MLLNKISQLYTSTETTVVIEMSVKMSPQLIGEYGQFYTYYYKALLPLKLITDPLTPQWQLSLFQTIQSNFLNLNGGSDTLTTSNSLWA